MEDTAGWVRKGEAEYKAHIANHLASFTGLSPHRVTVRRDPDTYGYNVTLHHSKNKRDTFYTHHTNKEEFDKDQDNRRWLHRNGSGIKKEQESRKTTLRRSP